MLSRLRLAYLELEAGEVFIYVHSHSISHSCRHRRQFSPGNRSPTEVFTPEDLNEDQRQIAATAARFAREEILPTVAAIEAKESGVMAALLRKAAELGFTAVDIPEEYGGMGMDKVTSTVVTDHLSVLASFSTAFGAHTGIGTLPLVWYGTEEQKQRYLPKLASCEWIAAYGLSEASSGSDAMNIRTRAMLSADGAHYILNGEKQWITNCGIAGLYTVFAKIDGEKFSAFLVERDTPGLTRGRRRAQAGHSRLVDLPAGSCRTARCRAKTCWASRARAITSRSTCSTWAGSSWAWPAWAARVMRWRT